MTVIKFQHEYIDKRISQSNIDHRHRLSLTPLILLSGFLECGNGTLLKPLQSGGRGECELDLYHRVFDPACTCPVLLQLRPLIPRYLGTYTLPEHPQGTTHMEKLKSLPGFPAFTLFDFYKWCAYGWMGVCLCVSMP